MKPIIEIDGQRIDPDEFAYSQRMDALPCIMIGDKKLEVSYSNFAFDDKFKLVSAVIETVAKCKHKYLGALRPTQNGYKTDQFCLKCRQWKSEIGVSPSVLARMSNRGHGT